MKIITILGDSLSMIRSANDIYLKDLYSYKLQESLRNDYYVVNNAIRGGHIFTQIKKLSDNVLYNNSSIVIIFFGIVDCFPRLFTLRDRRLMNIFEKLGLGFINEPLIKFKSKHRFFFTKYNKKVYVSKSEFMENYDKIISRINKINELNKIILVNIASTDEATMKRNFEVDKTIKEYNKLILKISKKYKNIDLLDFYNISKDNPHIMLEDGQHINKSGHNLLFELLVDKIKNIG